MTESGDKQMQTWGMACHLAALCGLAGIPFANIIGPLVVWLIKKDEYPFVDDQGKESLNFQISMTIYGIVSVLLCFVLVGFLLVPAVILADLILVIMAAVAASRGESYRYPVTIRLIK